MTDKSNVPSTNSDAQNAASPRLPTRFEPVRRSLAEYFGEDAGARGAVITYLSRQGGVVSERLRAADHEALLDALQKLAGTDGVKVHVVDENASWSERMHAIVQSTIVLSVHGAHLADAAFMRRTPQSALMEFFPPNVFNRDCETVVQSMGIRYVAWWGDQKYTGRNLPPYSQMATHEDFALDAQAVVRTITEDVNRRTTD